MSDAWHSIRIRQFEHCVVGSDEAVRTLAMRLAEVNHKLVVTRGWFAPDLATERAAMHLLPSSRTVVIDPDSEY